MSKVAVVVMGLLCALALASVLYLRLGHPDGLTRIAVVMATVTVAVLMVLFVGRARSRAR